VAVGQDNVIATQSAISAAQDTILAILKIMLDSSSAIKEAKLSNIASIKAITTIFNTSFNKKFFMAIFSRLNTNLIAAEANLSMSLTEYTKAEAKHAEATAILAAAIDKLAAAEAELTAAEAELAEAETEFEVAKEEEAGTVTKDAGPRESPDQTDAPGRPALGKTPRPDRAPADPARLFSGVNFGAFVDKIKKKRYVSINY
jgi:hypothetical protein